MFEKYNIEDLYIGLVSTGNAGVISILYKIEEGVYFDLTFQEKCIEAENSYRGYSVSDLKPLTDYYSKIKIDGKAEKIYRGRAMKLCNKYAHTFYANIF